MFSLSLGERNASFCLTWFWISCKVSRSSILKQNSKWVRKPTIIWGLYFVNSLFILVKETTPVLLEKALCSLNVSGAKMVPCISLRRTWSWRTTQQSSYTPSLPSTRSTRPWSLRAEIRAHRSAGSLGSSASDSFTEEAISETVHATWLSNLSRRKAYSTWQRRSTSAAFLSSVQLWSIKERRSFRCLEMTNLQSRAIWPMKLNKHGKDFAAVVTLSSFVCRSSPLDFTTSAWLPTRITCGGAFWACAAWLFINDHQNFSLLTISPTLSAKLTTTKKAGGEQRSVLSMTAAWLE